MPSKTSQKFSNKTNANNEIECKKICKECKEIINSFHKLSKFANSKKRTDEFNDMLMQNYVAISCQADQLIEKLKQYDRIFVANIPFTTYKSSMHFIEKILDAQYETLNNILTDSIEITRVNNKHTNNDFLKYNNKNEEYKK